MGSNLRGEDFIDEKVIDSALMDSVLLGVATDLQVSPITLQLFRSFSHLQNCQRKLPASPLLSGGMNLARRLAPLTHFGAARDES